MVSLSQLDPKEVVKAWTGVNISNTSWMRAYKLKVNPDKAKILLADPRGITLNGITLSLKAELSVWRSCWAQLFSATQESHQLS